MVSAAHSNNALEHSQPSSPKYIPTYGQTGSHHNIFFVDNGSATPTNGSELLNHDVSHTFQENNGNYANGMGGLSNGYSSSMNSINADHQGYGAMSNSAYSNYERGGAMPLTRSSTERFHVSPTTGIIPLATTSSGSKLSGGNHNSNWEKLEILDKSGSKQNLSPKNPKLYKTELCRSWVDHGRCNYGDRCQYAHGENEKRPIPRHPKYKTEACQSYHKTGYCPYGPRCHFIHNEDPATLARMIADNAAAVAHLQPPPSPLLQMSPSQARPKNLHIPLSASASAPVSALTTPVGSMAKNPMSFANHIPPSPQQIQQEALTSTPKQNSLFYRKTGDSTGGSPIPSSADSGTESPLGSFSPSYELDDSLSRLSPNSFRRSISSNGHSAGLATLLNKYSGSNYSGSRILNSALSNLSSKKASQSFPDWSTNSITKGIHDISLGNNSSSSLLSDSDSSGIGRTPPNGLARAPNDLPKSATLGAMPTYPSWPSSSSPSSSNSSNPNRLPVFERLSNGPL